MDCEILHKESWNILVLLSFSIITLLPREVTMSDFARIYSAISHYEGLAGNYILDVTTAKR